MRDPFELDELGDEQTRKMKAGKDKLNVPLQSDPFQFTPSFSALYHQTQANKGGVLPSFQVPT